MNTRQTRSAGFTLVEIMIVVAIIGLLLALAIPAFGRARTRSAQNVCISNLRCIDQAKARWALDARKGGGVQPDDDDLFGPGAYIGNKPKCPAGGRYDLNKIKDYPTCTVSGHTLEEDSSTSEPNPSAENEPSTKPQKGSDKTLIAFSGF